MANYAERVLADLKARYAHEPEFLQAATEILTTLKPVIDKNEEKFEAAGLLERFVEPDRIITFRVPWIDDQGTVRATAASSTGPSALTRAASGSRRTCIPASSSSWALSRF